MTYKILSLWLLAAFQAVAATSVLVSGFESGNYNAEKFDVHLGGSPSTAIVQIVNTPVYSGTKSSKHDLNWVGSGTTTTANSYRAELRIPQNEFGFNFGTEYWVGFRYRLESWGSDTSAEIAPFQIHRVPSDWSKPCGGQVSAMSVAPLVMRTKDNISSFFIKGKEYGKFTPVSGQWVKLVFNIKVGFDNSAFVKVWRDDVLVVDNQGANHQSQPDDCGGQWKPPTMNIGIYKWDWKTGRPKTKVTRRLLYIDQFHIATGTDGYSLVSGGTAPPDTTPPVVSAVQSSAVTASTALINWTTDEVSDSKILYGSTTSYGFSKTDSSLVTTHSLTLSGLDPNTVYHYKVQSKDAYGNVGSGSDKTFKTLDAGGNPPPTDVTPPVISSVTSSPKWDSSTVLWNTDEPANSLVDFGQTTSYGLNVSTGALVTEHSLQLPGLLPNTLYHYRVKSTDAANNTAIDVDRTFTTQSAPDSAAPVISNVQAIVAATSADFMWDLNEPGNCTVQYGLTVSYGLSLTKPPLVTSCALSVNNLTPGTTYHYRVKSKDAAGNERVHDDMTFSTPSVAPGTVIKTKPSC